MVRKFNIKICIFICLFILCSCSSNNSNSILNDIALIEREPLLNETKQTKENVYEKLNLEVADSDSIKNTLMTLCTNIRNYGSSGEITASKYLYETLYSYGFETTYQHFPVYKQTFSSTLFVKTNNEYFEIEGKDKLGEGINVIAKSPNYSSDKKTLYLTAHYDSTSDSTGVIDNGTGVSVLLEVARIIKESKLPFNVEIILFSGEEYYRAGSRHFVSHLTQQEKENALGCINVDMVGEIGADEVIILTYAGRNNVMTLMNNSTIAVHEGGYSSDDLSFYMGKLPVITLTNKNSIPSRSKEDNQYQYVDYEQLAEVTNTITTYITNFNLEEYLKKFSLKASYDIKTYSETLIKINSFKLEEVYDVLLENGYDSATEYLYTNDKEQKVYIEEKSIKCVDPKEYSNFIVSNADENWSYVINEKSENGIKINFANTQNIYTIKGDISIDEAKIILEDYYKQDYIKVFKKEPNSLLIS